MQLIRFLMGFWLLIGITCGLAYGQEEEKEQKNRSFNMKIDREYTDSEYRKLVGRSTRSTKAALLSVVFPGGGQIYNKSYWKIPIFYTGLAFLGFITSTNHQEFIEARNNLAYITDDDAANNSLIDQRFGSFEAENFVDRRDRFRRERDYYMILTLLWYALGVADAAVDAHLSKFSVAEDLSMSIKPNLMPVATAITPQQNAFAAGVTLSFHLK